MSASNSYATDGRCHNSELGTYGHECGKPAEWVGRTLTGFKSGFCDDCKLRGYEASTVLHWQRFVPEGAFVVVIRAGEFGSHERLFGFGPTEREARRDAEFQIAGAGPAVRAHMRDRWVCEPVDAETASEIAEMLEAPVLEWLP